MSVLAALPLSSMFLSCLARISVFQIFITENRSVCFHETKILLFIFRKWRGRSPFGQSVDYTTPTINKCCTPHQYTKVCLVIAVPVCIHDSCRFFTNTTLRVKMIQELSTPTTMKWMLQEAVVSRC